MTLQQIEELLNEIGDRMPAAQVKPLNTEYEIKLLMEKVPLLRRDLAKLLVVADGDPEGSMTQQRLSQELSTVFERNGFTESALSELRIMCGVGGAKLFERAVKKYRTSPSYKALEMNAIECLHSIDDPECDDGAPHQQAAEKWADELPEDERQRLQDHLRDEYGLESVEDWTRLIQARHCIAKRHPQKVTREGYKAARKFARLAKQLADDSKVLDCMPAELMEWRDTKAKIREGRVNPGSIINVPGGGQVWGDGEAVRPDKEGRPKHKMIDIFGNEVASNEMPDVTRIDRMVNTAWKNPQKRTR